LVSTMKIEMPACFGASGSVRAGEPDVVGVLGEAGEDLAAVDDVVVAVLHGAGAQRGEVGAGLRLRVADRRVQLALQDARQEVALLLVGAELHDRVADRVDGQERQREAGALHLVAEDELLERRAALAAVLLRPADADPAVGAHLLQRLMIERPAAALAAALDLLLQLVGHHARRNSRAGGREASSARG
jgi:hypothetical protein